MQEISEQMDSTGLAVDQEVDLVIEDIDVEKDKIDDQIGKLLTDLGITNMQINTEQEKIISNVHTNIRRGLPQVFAYPPNDQEVIIVGGGWSLEETFDDLLEAVKQPLPPDYKRILYAFADHLTFHRELGTFLEEHQIDRAELRGAIEWCIETIFSRSKSLSLQNRDQQSPRNIPKSLFRATVKENGLKRFVEEMDEGESKQIRRLS